MTKTKALNDSQQFCRLPHLLAAATVIGSSLLAAPNDIDRIASSDTEITIIPTQGTVGEHPIVALEPYDSYQSSRNWALGATSNGATLDFDRDEALLIRFQSNEAAFDPQLQNLVDEIDANRVRHLTIRAKVLNFSGTIPATAFVFGDGGFSKGGFQIIADGEWHFARLDLSTLEGPVTWSGLKSLRIDFPDDLDIDGFEATEVLVDWIAVTRQENFTNPLTWSRWDRFWDLGYQAPVATLSGANPSSFSRRLDGEDLYYKKFVMLDERLPVGSPHWVSDFSNMSYRTVTDHGFVPTGGGAGQTVIDEGILRMDFTSGAGLFDPQLVNSNREIDGDRCGHVHVRVRMNGYQGSEESIKATVFSTAGGISGSDADFDPNGGWQNLHFDMSGSPGWGGYENLRLDLPNDTQAWADFSGATLEVDWIAVTKGPDFNPNSDLEGYELRYDFEIDRRQATLIDLKGRKGIEDLRAGDIDALDPQVTKLNFKVDALVDRGANPRVTWKVDGIPFGLNPQLFDSIHEKVTSNGHLGINTYMVMLNQSNDVLVNDSAWPFIDIRSTDQAPFNLYAFNTSDPYGLRYTRAAFEYLAHRMSQPGVTAFDHWIYGNEIDAHWFWHHLGEISSQDFIDCFSVEFRQAALVLAQYHPEFRLLLSHTNHWTGRVTPQNPERSFSSKELIDQLNQIWNSGGNFKWEVASHPYPQNLFEPRFWLDANANLDFETPYLSYKNLEVLSEYFEQPELLFEGEKRPISLTEQGFHTPDLNGPGDNPDRLDGQRIQAAAWAYHWHRFKHLPGLKTDITHRYSDNPFEGGLFLGLIRDLSDTPKLAFEVFAAAERSDWRTAFDPYLPLLPFDSFDDAASLPAWTTLDLPFDETGFAEGFRSLNNVDSLSQIEGGLLTGTITGEDPQIGNLDYFNYLPESSRLLIRVKVSSGTRLELFWATRERDFFSEDRKLTIATIADNEFHLYEFPIENHPEWGGKVMTQLRIDPSEAAHGTFEIDYLATGFPDSDGDGASDADEKLWNRNALEPEDPDVNADGDAYSDIDAMIMGTDPDDATSFFRQELSPDESADTQGLVSSFFGRPGRTYLLQRSRDLGRLDLWKQENFVTPKSEELTKIRIRQATDPQMFYRYLVK